MIPLVGYTDRFSAAPGEHVAFKISSAFTGDYGARLVRVICGDPNPDGPGILEDDLSHVFSGRFPSRVQAIHAGSSVEVADHPALAGLAAFTLVATIRPTRPDAGWQAVMAKLDQETGAGFALGIDANGAACFRVGAGAGGTVEVTTARALRPHTWYRVWASWDGNRNMMRVGQRPLVPAFGVDGTAAMRMPGPPAPAIDNDAPLGIAAIAGHPPTDHFDGKVEAPKLLPRAHVRVEDAEADTDALVAWDFTRDIPTTTIRDVGPHGLDGRLLGMPARGMTGSTWTGREHCWRHAPEDYGAIHFHSDDLADCGWDTDFTFEVPPDLPSGVYAMRLETDDPETWDAIPFIVRPPRGKATADVCVLMPTFTYLIYANHARRNTDEAYRERAAAWGARPWTPDDHPEYGLSTYNVHKDRSGICHASAARPLTTMRSGMLTLVDPRGSGLRHFPADTHLIAWLVHEGIDFDVVTDHDLDDDGVELIAPYSVVLTGSHPEYHTRGTLDALEEYAHRRGGRLMYMGGNGFYWHVARHAEHPEVLEIRRGEGGIRAWASEPGEYWNAFDGTYGGLWRRNGRPPQRLAGVGFSAQGLFEGSYYRLAPGAADPRVKWMFEGIEGEVVGDHGLSGGGAAGFELDRVEPRLGSPPNTLVVASSEAHQEHFVLVPEEWLTHVTTWAGKRPDTLIRADMAFFETANGGAVFSTGSITYCGSLPVNGFDNDVARLTRNVVDRFRDPTPLAED